MYCAHEAASISCKVVCQIACAVGLFPAEVLCRLLLLLMCRICVYCYSFLVEKYKISIIPKLVIIRPDGEVVTTKGRKDVQDKGLISFRGWHSAMIAATKKADQQQQLLEQLEADEATAAEQAAATGETETSTYRP